MAISTDFLPLESGKLELTVKGPSKSHLTTGAELFGNAPSTLALTAMSTKLMLSGMLISEMDPSEVSTSRSGMAAEH